MHPTISKAHTDRFLQKLRQATSAMHEKLEGNKLSKNLMKDDVSVDDYTAYLQKMKAVIAFCERDIFPAVAEVVPDIEERKKFLLLKADLCFFGKDDAENSPAYEPFEQATTSFVLGYMYVIEGSTLGGRVILKHLTSRLNVNENNGGSFFAGYKEHTGSKWKSFLQHFSDYALMHNCEEEIITGAQNAFETIHRHFES